MPSTHRPICTGCQSTPHGQVQPVMTSESNVTAPFRASALPSRFTPVVIVMDVSARMFPLKSELVPSVAELPTCQKTLQAVAPLARTTWLPLPVVSVDPIWKMNTAPGLPAPSRVTSPDIASDEVDL